MGNAGNGHGLTDLGFSELEAAIYTHLLREGPSSAYAVARALGKPVANTYHATESLRQKSALALVEDGQTRLARAVDPAELVAGMQREYAERCTRTVRGLQALGRHEEDDRVYTLRSRAQVLARARQMLASARKCMVIDIFPAQLGELLPEIRAAAARGVAAAAMVYEPAEIRGVEVVVHARPQLSNELFPGGMLGLGIDGCEHLLALFGETPDELRQALWTQSAWLAVVQHNGLVCEILTQGLDQALEGRRSLDELRGLRERMRRVSVLVAPGLEKLMRLRGGKRATERTGGKSAGRKARSRGKR